MKVGKVFYLNTLPLFYKLKDIDIVEGHPSELAKLLREGKISAGIVSSVEYFFNPDLYYILPNVSISSRKEVCSVLLLSKKPISEVRRVKITTSSLTSRYLLLFLFDRLWKRKIEEVKEDEDAYLCIGDEAISLRKGYPFVYDLGREWYKLTNLPFVFALFLVRKETPQEEIRRLYSAVKESIKSFFSDLTEGRISFKDSEITYFTECIDYGLSSEHIRSLDIFFRFMEKVEGKRKPTEFKIFEVGSGG